MMGAEAIKELLKRVAIDDSVLSSLRDKMKRRNLASEAA